MAASKRPAHVPELIQPEISSPQNHCVNFRQEILSTGKKCTLAYFDEKLPGKTKPIRNAITMESACNPLVRHNLKSLKTHHFHQRQHLLALPQHCRWPWHPWLDTLFENQLPNRPTCDARKVGQYTLHYHGSIRPNQPSSRNHWLDRERSEIGFSRDLTWKCAHFNLHGKFRSCDH